MDMPSSSRPKLGTVTYARRNRTPSKSAQSSPAVGRSSFAAAGAGATNVASSSSASSDDEAGPSDTRSKRRAGAALTTNNNASPSSHTRQTNNISPKNRNEHASTTPTASASTSSRAALISKSASSTTTGLFPKPGSSSSSSSRLNTTKSLPQRPPRAASPTPTTKSNRSPIKKSASTSPRKLASSVPSSNRRALARTPSHPPQDLASLFDAIEPTLPQPRSSFTRSESQPTVRLHQNDADDALLAASPVFAPSPLASPTLPSIGFDHLGELPSPDASASPSKRPRMADRMAPRSARPTRSKVDEIADALTDSRRGSLRRTETAPSLMSDASPLAAFPADAGRPASLGAKEHDSKSARQSDAASTLPDAVSQTDGLSTEGTNSASGARRLAGIKRASASNAKRTYGLQRSFLADQAEDQLLSDPASPSVRPRTIEDEIEAELKGNGNGSATASTNPTPASKRVPHPAATAPRESYAELLRKWGEGADDIEWDESQDPTLNLKSITSLRSQGELRRFNDDLEYLFSGLDASQALSIRQSSAVELVNVLCGKPDVGSLGGEDDASDADDNDDDVEDPLAAAQSAEFLRKLKASDLIARLFDLCKDAQAGEGVDNVLDAAVTIYLAKILRSASSAETLARERWSQLFTTLRDLLIRSDRAYRQERKDGFALLRLHELKQFKIATRSERKTLVELRDMARMSKLFVAGAKSWTLRNLVLAACCSLIGLPRRLLTEAAIHDLLVDANSPEDRSQPSSLFGTVLNVLVLEGVKAQQRLVDFTKGLELVTPAAVETIPDLETVDLCIRFLDRGMDILYLELDQAVPASNETLDALQHLVSFAIQAAPFGVHSASDDVQATRDRSTASRALQILHGLFKTLLDLSQVDANWSETLASSQSLQLSVMRAFSLGYRSASQVRQAASQTNGARRIKSKFDETEHVAGTEAQKLDVALFDDVVHLSLALLTNLLIKQLDKARDTLQQVRLDPTCWRRRACTTECACDTSLPALQLLARVFFETRIAAASHDDSHTAYLSNSIATALAQFAVGGPARLDTCRAALDAELPSSKSKARDLSVIKQDGFTTLLDAVEEFAVVHEAALHAERARAAQASSDADTDVVMQETDGDQAAEGAQADSTTISVAAEAGQLIKDLATSLRRMM